MTPFYIIVKNSVQLYFKMFHRFKILGTKNVPKKGAFLLASNHISNLDPPVVGCSCPRELFTMAKKELFQKQPLAWAISNLNAFPVDRDDVDMAALRKSLKVIKAGYGLLMFPEGTRRPPGDPLQYRPKPGLGMLAIRTKVPIVPVGVQGTIEKKAITIRYGEPIPPEAYSDFGKSMEEYEKLANQVMDHIKQLAES